MCFANKMSMTGMVLALISAQASVFAAEEITVIPEIKVQAENRDRPGLNARAQTTTLTQKNIQDSPAVTLANLLKQEQSTVRLTNNSGDGSQTALSLRGFGDNAVANTLILVDGFPLTNATLLAPNLNAINLADIERVEILPGSQGVLWGDQAVGGVVNIITKHPGKWSATLVGGLGDFNLRTGYGLLSHRFDHGFFFKTSVLGFTNQHYRDHNQQQDGQLTVLAGFDYANGSLQIDVSRSDHTSEFPGGLTYAQYHANPRQATDHTSHVYYLTNTVQLLSQHAFNDDWLLETRLAHQALNGDGFIFSDFNRAEHETLFHPRLIGHWNRKQLILGYQALVSDYKLQNKFVATKAMQQQQDAYAQIVIPWSSSVNVTAGARTAWQFSDAEKVIGDSLTSRHQLFVPELGVDYRPNSAWRFYLRRQGNFRLPKANEVTWAPASSPVLQPQTGVSYETGLVWENQQHQVQLNLYDLRLRDEIAFDPTQTADEPFGSYRNFNSTERRGVSLSDVYQWNDKTTLDAQINYVDPRFRSVYTGNQIPAVPQFTANAGWRYRLNEFWRVRYNVLYTGQRYASEDVLNAGRQLSGYWLHAAAIQYVCQSLEVSFSVENLLNQTFPAYTLFHSDSNTNTYYPGAGRSYLLTLKWKIE